MKRKFKIGDRVHGAWQEQFKKGEFEGIIWAMCPNDDMCEILVDTIIGVYPNGTPDKLHGFFRELTLLQPVESVARPDQIKDKCIHLIGPDEYICGLTGVQHNASKHHMIEYLSPEELKVLRQLDSIDWESPPKLEDFNPYALKSVFDMGLVDLNLTGYGNLILQIQNKQ